MPTKVVVSVGTKRGLFLFESNAKRQAWKVKGPFLKGWQIFHAVIDTRGTPQLHAAVKSDIYGSSIMSGKPDSGKFKATTKPPQIPKVLPSQAKSYKKYGLPIHPPQVWHIEPGPAKEKKVLYAGSSPAALFRSEDEGRSWQEVTGLTKHPSRKNWMPGAGGMCLHSIQIDSQDPNIIFIAISASGSFRTNDGGKTWTPINKAVASYPGAPKASEVGTCVHKLLMHPRVPGLLYQQNHVGVYRSDNWADTWQRIDKGLPTDFGFGLALNVSNPDTCYVVPLEPEGGTFRATGGRFQVHTFKGTGKGWRDCSKGLPQENAYLSVLREGMSHDTLSPGGIYIGTGSGHVFHSADEGQSWQALAEFLPPVLSVSAAVVE